MTIWEHHYELIPAGESVSEVLDRMGLLGWEPWHVTRVNLGEPPGIRSIYFKRPKKDAP